MRARPAGHDSEALITLPRGPREMNRLWYARARLGVTIFGCFCWGASLPPAGKWICLFTRVLEKPVELSVCLFRRVLEILNLGRAL